MDYQNPTTTSLGNAAQVLHGLSVLLLGVAALLGPTRLALYLGGAATLLANLGGVLNGAGNRHSVDGSP